MITDRHFGAHSARVQMQLLVDGAAIGITHMGPDFLVIEPSSDYPPGEATIVLRIDDSERRWKVRLPWGISRDSREVALGLA